MAARIKKTTKMLEVERDHAQEVGILVPIDLLLPRLIDSLGKKGAREQMGISKATLNTWMLKMGLELRVVSVGGSPDVET